jgi:hypothetical protein
VIHSASSKYILIAGILALPMVSILWMEHQKKKPESDLIFVGWGTCQESRNSFSLGIAKRDQLYAREVSRKMRGITHFWTVAGLKNETSHPISVETWNSLGGIWNSATVNPGQSRFFVEEQGRVFLRVVGDIILPSEKPQDRPRENAGSKSPMSGVRITTHLCELFVLDGTAFESKPNPARYAEAVLNTMRENANGVPVTFLDQSSIGIAIRGENDVPVTEFVPATYPDGDVAVLGPDTAVYAPGAAPDQFLKY